LTAEEKDVFVLNLLPDSHREVNAFQRGATVVVQKSIREGFGLVVSEAMWKEKPVVGANVGGIRRQIRVKHRYLITRHLRDYLLIIHKILSAS